jgi:hypothetical protein
LIHGLITLQKKIDGQSIRNVKWYQKEDPRTAPMPLLGPDLIDPRDLSKLGGKKTTKTRKSKQ